MAKRKRGRSPSKAPPYPPPPPPPPPPVNNPYYQKFFADYWKKYGQGYQNLSRTAGGGGGGVPGAALPPPPKRVTVPFVPPPPAVPLMVDPPAIPDAPATRGQLPQGEYPCDKTDRQTFVLAAPGDEEHLSDKQCYVRTRLCEIFLSDQSDVERSVRGRRAAFLGQVGLRCVFCIPALESKDRVERAICYPTKIAKFYQTVQDMQHFHFNTCPAIPLQVKERYLNCRGNMNNRRGEDKMSPKDYWTKVCGEVGLIDHIGADGSHVGVKLTKDHHLVPRARLPEYAKELFMPPGSQPEDTSETGEMSKVSNGESEAGNDAELALDLDEGDKDGGEDVDDDQVNGEGENNDEQDESDAEMDGNDDDVDDPDNAEGEMDEPSFAEDELGEPDIGESEMEEQDDGAGESDDQGGESC